MTGATNEHWRPVRGFDSAYAISDQGRVRNERTGRVLKPETARNGYLRVDLRDNRRKRKASIHRLVAEAFHGPPPSGAHTHVAHRDGVRANNARTNLRWATPAENCADMWEHGTRALGARHGSAKLSLAEAAAIRTLYRPGRAPTLARMLGVSPSTVRRIGLGALWTDLERA